MSPPAQKAFSPAPCTTIRVTAGSLRPGVEGAAHLAHHGQGQGVERLRTVERDEARLALLLAEDFDALVHGTLLHLDAA